MPYISKNKRVLYEGMIKFLVEQLWKIQQENMPLPGDCNYIICKLLLEAFKIKDEPKYNKFNCIIGILESVKLEINRRWMAEYENSKIKIEGDIL